MGAGGLMVEKIKEQVSLADVFRFYNLDLVRGKMCCPFHNEKTPSLSVKGEIWKCFGCGAGGDSIGFVMKYENLNFKQACDFIDRNFSLGLNETLDFKSFRQQKSKHEERIATKKKKEEDEKKANKEFRILCAYNHWLINQPLPNTKEILFDLEFMDRLIDSTIKDRKKLLSINALALCTALMTKHKGAVSDGI